MSSTMRRKRELLEVARNHRESQSTTDSAIYHFLSALDSPRSLTVWLLYKFKEHDQLTELSCNPKDYLDDPVKFRNDYTATNFLAKASFLKTTFDRKEVAMKKFFKYEELCRQTNSRLRSPLQDPLRNGPCEWLYNATIRKIEWILGDFTADEVVDSANWGPGVTTLVKGEEVSAFNKFHSENGITRDLYALVSPFFESAYPLWSSHLTSKFGEQWADHQVGNVIVTVPKNSKTDRTIAIEPGINLWFQKAIGSMIRRRLRRVGIDLNSQERNQQLALRSSKDDSLATVDFSSASDSISKVLVEELVPRRWFALLDTCRSRFGKHSDSLLEWEKFSSMGNGFTFELESLIFYAAALAVCDYLGVSSKDVSVFGDDVIIPKECYSLFSDYSRFLGFIVNDEKSFSSYNFRESCGSHYYSGLSCKPLFLKERIRNVEAIYKLANGIRLLSHRYNSHYGCDIKFLELWLYLFFRVPEPLRLRVPLIAGDTGFISNFDEASPSKARYGIEGYFYRSLTTVGVKRQSDEPAMLLARLWGSSEQEYGNTYTLRGRTRRSISDSLVHQWYNLGPWI